MPQNLWKPDPNQRGTRCTALWIMLMCLSSPKEPEVIGTATTVT